MDKELQEALIIIVFVAISRYMSHREHTKSKRDGKERGEKLDNIYLMMNGEFQKKIEQARKEGFEEGRNSK